MSDVIAWLESSEGEEWSFNYHTKLWRPLILIVGDGSQSADMDDWSMAFVA